MPARTAPLRHRPSGRGIRGAPVLAPAPALPPHLPARPAAAPLAAAPGTEPCPEGTLRPSPATPRHRAARSPLTGAGERPTTALPEGMARCEATAPRHSPPRLPALPRGAARRRSAAARAAMAEWGGEAAALPPRGDSGRPQRRGRDAAAAWLRAALEQQHKDSPRG